jgi:recombination protein RecR
MYRLPKVLNNLTESFERLPGIGPRTAARLAFYLLTVPQSFLDDFSDALGNIKKRVLKCQTCFGVDENDPCYICADPKRNKGLICVVESPLDVIAIEKTGKFEGVYHVLGGVLNPLAHISPEDLKIGELLERVEKGLEEGSVEVLLATNPTMEGEATALFIKKEIGKALNGSFGTGKLKISRIGSGLPVGADLGYADEVTLSKALSGRGEF